MFEKLVGIEPLHLVPSAETAFSGYAREVVLYRDIPTDNAEMIRRIKDADAVLVSYTSTIDKEVLASCPKLRYVGMCCSLYAPESANVDIRFASEHGIAVKGVRDYGDKGVVEYVVSELSRFLLGLGETRWGEQAEELAGLRMGVIGLGVSGRMVAEGLRFFGAETAYYSRTRKPEAEKDGIRYLPLTELMASCDMVCTCLNKNIILLGDAELEAFGSHKILFNTGLTPSFEPQAFKRWISDPTNTFFSDNTTAMGCPELLTQPNIHCLGHSSGMTRQARERLSQKVLSNIADFLMGK